MALSIAIEGTGIIANCDGVNDTAGGGWTEVGGGTLVFDPDTFLFGTSCIGNKYASKSGWSYLDKNTALDFDTGGAQEGEMLFIWLNIAAPNAFDTLATPGFAIRLGSSTTIYREWNIAGEDDSNGWAGGWKLFALDPTTAGSTDSGTYDPGNVDLIGVYVDTNASVRAESIFIDQIACGKGLRITGTWDDGTYEGAWDEVLAYCTDYANRAWGMLQERDGILYGFGKFYIGDSTQAIPTSFEDAGKVFQFGTSQYHNGTDWVTTMKTDSCGIIIEDAASYATEFIDGVPVGSDNGRSGSTYLGNEDQNIVLDLYGGNNAASTTLFYGTAFKNIKGSFNSGNNAGHEFLGCSFTKCSQFDPVGGPVIRNCVFAETVDIDASFLWNDNVDIEDCNFIANTIGAAIEHVNIDNSPFTYTGLIFSGNTYDVLNVEAQTAVTAGTFVVGDGYKVVSIGTTDFTLIGSANNTIGTKFIATGAGTGTGTATECLVINKTSLSDPSSAENAGSNSDTIFSASYTHTITGLKLNTEVTYVVADTTTVLFHVEAATTSDGDGTYQTAYTHSGGESVDILIHHKDYKPDISNVYGITLGNLNESAKVQMFLDENYYNPA